MFGAQAIAVCLEVQHFNRHLLGAAVGLAFAAGGSVANADPAACYPAGLLGLGATVHTTARKIADRKSTRLNSSH